MWRFFLLICVWSMLAVPALAAPDPKVLNAMQGNLNALEKTAQDGSLVDTYVQRIERDLKALEASGLDGAPFRARMQAAVQRLRGQRAAEDEILGFAQQVDVFVIQLRQHLADVGEVRRESLATKLDEVERFLGKEAIDYPGILAAVDEAIAANPKVTTEVQTKRGVDPRDNRTEKTTANLRFLREEWPKLIGGFCNDVLVPSARTYLASAQKDVTDRTYRASLQAEAAAGLAARAAIYLPTDAAIAKISADMEKAREGIRTQLEAKYATTALHKENLGKILFSKRPIVPGKEKPTDFQTAFQPGDTIYGVVYHIAPMHDLAGFGVGTSVQMSVTLKIDDAEPVIETWYLDAKSPQAELAALTFELVPDAKATKQPGFAARILNTLAQISAEKHKVAISLAVRVPDMSVADTIADAVELDIDAGRGLQAWVAAQGVMAARHLAEARMPKPVMKDSGVAAGMVDAIRKAGWKEKPLRSVISDGDFQFYRNIFGTVIQRSVNGHVAVKRADGTCAVFFAQFNQKALGNGWSAVGLNAVWNSFDILCENVDK